MQLACGFVAATPRRSKVMATPPSPDSLDTGRWVTNNGGGAASTRREALLESGTRTNPNAQRWLSFWMNPVLVVASNEAMKTPSSLFLLLAVSLAGMRLLAQGQAPAEPPKEPKTESPAKVAPSAPPLPSDPEERFKFLFTNASLSGRWAALRDGQLGEERSGDKYSIVSVTKGNGSNWIVSAKMKYRDQEFVMPIPVQMKFTGDAAIMEVNNLAIPGGGTYTARLMIYEWTYSGTWKGQRGGGMLYGTITKEQE